MPKLSANESYIRKATRDISYILDLPESVVRSVIDALSLHMLESLRYQGLHPDDDKHVSVELPNIGTLILTKSKYPDNERAILQGQAFRPKFVVKDAFLLRCRYAYYDHHNYLLDDVTNNFMNMFDEHYTSIVRGSDNTDEQE